MKLKIHQHLYTLTFCGALSAGLLVQNSHAAGGIVTDGTMGAAQSLTGTQITIPQNLGTTVGQNLFHSFGQFNVQTGQSVTFTENTTNSLNNVISRVTGGSSSDINGLIRSTPGGHANFYLINPAGVVFGKDAQIDVPGAFHVSTASELKFADGNRFSASNLNGSSLSSVEPSSFGFLASSAGNNGLLQVQGAQLAVKDNQALDLVAGSIQTSSNATLAAPAGEIRLVAMQGAGDVGLVKTDGVLPLPDTMPTANNAGVITSQDTYIKTTGDGGGRVGVWGGEVAIATQDANNLHGIDAFNTGSTDASPAKGVAIKASDVSLDGTRVRTESRNIGKAGDIQIQANLDIGLYRGGRIQSYTNENQTGDTGNIKLLAGRDFTLDGANTPAGVQTIVTTASFDSKTGNASDIRLNAGRNLIITNSGIIRSLAYDNTTGNSGNVIVQANGDFTLNNSYITSSVFQNGSGNSGDISVQAHGNIQMSQGSSIFSNSASTGRASTISVSTNGDLVSGGDIFVKSKKGDANANSGSVNVTSKGNLTLLPSGGIDSYTYANRNAANIAVVVGKDFIFNGFIESRNTNDGNPSDQLATGNSGNISVHVDGDINMTGANGEIVGQGIINSSPLLDGKGNAGNISVSAGGRLSMVNAASFLSGVFTEGHAGGIDVYAHGDINIEKLSGIVGGTAFAGKGSAGTIKVATNGNLTLKDRGNIASNTGGEMDAGNIFIDVKGGINLFNQSLITSSPMQAVQGSPAIASGNGGLISVQALGNIQLNNESGISGITSGLGNGGLIKVHTPKNLELNENSLITTATMGSGAAGNLEVNVNNLLVNSNSQISTASFKESSGGHTGQLLIDVTGLVSLDNSNINSTNAAVVSDAAAKLIKSTTIIVNAKNIDLTNKSYISTYAPGNVAAANIDINFTDSLKQSAGSYIISSGQTASGGAITIKGGDLLSLNNSYLSTKVFDGQGNGGNITISGIKELQVSNNGEINTQSSGAGAAGNVDIQAGNITLDKGFINSGSTGVNSSGLTGQVHLAAENRIGLNNSRISIENEAVLPEGASRAMIPSTISLTAKDINFTGSTIATTAHGNSDAGNIFINYSHSLTADANADYSTYIATNANTGNGGSITIHGGDLFRLNKSYLATTVAAGQGNGGNITIDTTGDLRIKNNGGIDTRTVAGGAAGNVNIHANNILLKNGFITSGSLLAGSSGKTGQIHLVADNGIVMRKGTVSIENEAVLSEDTNKSLKPSLISMTAKDMSLLAKSAVTTNAKGNTAAGNIAINFSHWLTQAGSTTISTAADTGNGGNISIKGGELFNQSNANLKTTVAVGKGNGGRINIAADVLLMENGLIQANAASGNGGNINLNLKAFIPSSDTLVIGGTRVASQKSFVPNYNIIQAVSQSGVSGVTAINAPQLNLSGVLANLGNPQFDSSVLSPDYCNLGAGSTLTRQGHGGLLPKGDDLLF